MLAGIMGFRIPIARIEGKFKVSQNRNAEERRNVFAAHSDRHTGPAGPRALDGAPRRTRFRFGAKPAAYVATPV